MRRLASDRRLASGRSVANPARAVLHTAEDRREVGIVGCWVGTVG